MSSTQIIIQTNFILALAFIFAFIGVAVARLIG